MPPGAPSESAYVEISGELSAQEHGFEPELLISSSSAEALGVALHGPSKLAFAAGAASNRSRRMKCRPLLKGHRGHADARALGVSYDQPGPDGDITKATPSTAPTASARRRRAISTLKPYVAFGARRR